MRVKTSECVTCRAVLNGAETVSDPNIHPKPNDVTICSYCGEVLQFNDDLSLRLISETVISEIDLMEMQKASVMATQFRKYVEMKKQKEKQKIIPPDYPPIK
jgi:hypothetical protein